MITGKTLINLGYLPSNMFPKLLDCLKTAIKAGNSMAEAEVKLAALYEQLKPAPTIPLQDPNDVEIHYNIDAGRNDYEKDNVSAVREHVLALATTPTIRKIAVMPDACPAGNARGTIPVGAVAVAHNAIHPGMHSADICCSLFLTEINEDFPVSTILDKVQEASHFGPGGRDAHALDATHDIMVRAASNMFMKEPNMQQALSYHLGTQGDGNHFFYVGRRRSTNNITLVTHHGSRKPGALLYKAGMKVAEKFRQELSPATIKHNAWIPFDTAEGHAYWDALEIIRDWTKLNHETIHDATMNLLGVDKYTDRFWNEHNFVFKIDDLFYHAKGATPVYGHSQDAKGKAIIPLNMGEPILICDTSAPPISNSGIGFAPHGAGRNFSRTHFKNMHADKTTQEIMDAQVGHIDARFYDGHPDISELPGAYKDANDVRLQIEKYGLCTVYDIIEPLGSMMAGDMIPNWKKKLK